MIIQLIDFFQIKNTFAAQYAAANVFVKMLYCIKIRYIK